MSLVRTKRLHDIDLRVRKDTEIAFLLDTVVRGKQYHAGDVVTGSLRKDARKLEYLFLRKRIGLWRVREIESADRVPVSDGSPENTPEKGAEDADRPLVGDDLPGTVEVTGQLVADLCPVGGETADAVQPKPYKSGPGWWRIEGVDEAFRTKDEAQAAWDLNHALGG